MFCLIAAAIRIAGRSDPAVCTGVKTVAVADRIPVVKAVAVCPATGVIGTAAAATSAAAVIVRAAAAVIIGTAACVAAACAVIIAGT